MSQATYSDVRPNSTGSMRTEFLVGTGRLPCCVIFVKQALEMAVGQFSISVLTRHLRRATRKADQTRRTLAGKNKGLTVTGCGARQRNPKNVYCLPTIAPVFEGYRASSVKLLKVESSTATVTVKKGMLAIVFSLFSSIRHGFPVLKRVSGRSPLKEVIPYG
jgi:hypothetical protein